MIHPYRHLARIVIEATTPLAVGSGEENVMTDRLVATDVNGLPFIPGTALAGVLRHVSTAENSEQINDLFGFQRKNDGAGSRLILSSARMLEGKGKVIDGIYSKNILADKFLKYFAKLPIRQHVRITHKGASEQGGKFDEQVVYKGTRFCFEMELISEAEDEGVWKTILDQFRHPAFRIGGGTRKGFGEIKVVDCKAETIDLRSNLSRYLEKSASLEDKTGWWKSASSYAGEKNVKSNWVTYELALKPEDFFLFGSAFGTDDADMSYVTEPVIEWKDDEPDFTENRVLIPAASVKGAIAHRVAFHFNKINEVFADKLIDPASIDELCKKGYYNFRCQPGDRFNSKNYDDRISLVTTYNPAVRKLFGYALDDDKEKGAQRGNVILSDIFLKEDAKKLLNHVAIDRFTGGAMDGALFSEEVVQHKDQFTLCMLVNQEAFKTKYVREAFENTLHDLCSGMLPLGGGTMRGHGCFKGNYAIKSHPDE